MKYANLIKSAISKVLDKTIGVFEMTILGIIVVSTLSYALAWQAPTGAPPAGNTDSPLNVGLDAQIKGGNLVVNALGITASGNALLVQNGNVGIGTASPGAKLAVAGNIKLGTSGELYAAGGAETLKIIRGTINADGTIRQGVGFSSLRLSAGYYRINFSTPFSTAPTIVVSAVGAAGPGDPASWFMVANLRREDEYVRTTSQFEVYTHYQQLGGTSDTNDRAWDFIAIGY